MSTEKAPLQDFTSYTLQDVTSESCIQPRTYMDTIFTKKDNQPSVMSVLHGLSRDPQFYFAIIIGVVVVWGGSRVLQSSVIPVQLQPWILFQFILLFPLLEELLFRGLLQGSIARRLPGKLGPLSRANIITSVLFVLAHLINQPPLWAVAVFIPSLVFGYFRDRYNHLLPSSLLHIIYNSAYYLLFNVNLN